MAKEITCDVIKTYCITDKTDFGDTRLCEVSWNKKKVTGVDIRKYMAEKDCLLKGITISYDGFTDIVKAAIENGLVKVSDVEEALEKRKKTEFSDADFSNMFNRMNQDEAKYQRDVYGMLRTREGNYVISSTKGRK